MDTGSFRFEIGEFECASIGDGAFNYPPESLFANVPLERIEGALRERNLVASLAAHRVRLFL
jgi:hypothetical protein